MRPGTGEWSARTMVTDGETQIFDDFWWWDSDFWQLANFTSHSPDYFGQNYPPSFVIDASHTFQGMIKIEKPWLKRLFAKQQTNIQVVPFDLFHKKYWGMVLKPSELHRWVSPAWAALTVTPSPVCSGCTMCNRIKWKLTTHSGAPGPDHRPPHIWCPGLLVCSHFLVRPPEPQSRWCRGL